MVVPNIENETTCQASARIAANTIINVNPTTVALGERISHFVGRNLTIDTRVEIERDYLYRF